MTTKEFPKKEINNIDKDKIDDVLKLKNNYLTNEDRNKDQDILTKLKDIKIKRPEDFSINLDQYLNGEKIIE
jgi:hypothetical protein